MSARRWSRGGRFVGAAGDEGYTGLGKQWKSVGMSSWRGLLKKGEAADERWKWNGDRIIVVADEDCMKGARWWEGKSEQQQGQDERGKWRSMGTKEGQETNETGMEIESLKDRKPQKVERTEKKLDESMEDYKTRLEDETGRCRKRR